MTTEQDKVAEFVSYLKERISTVRATAKEYSYAAHLLDNQDLYRISVEDVDEALTHIASLQTELAKHKASHDPLVELLRRCKKTFEPFPIVSDLRSMTQRLREKHTETEAKAITKGFAKHQAKFRKLYTEIKAALAAAEEGK